MPETTDLKEAVASERQRELAVEHLLFHTLVYVEHKHPGLIDHLEGSLERLGDRAHDETKDDEAVKGVARLFLESLRKSAAL
ncbi:hypothetical protein [Aureimonas sp. AU4]|uniref:hypothetical protein n=1 Tax=Aureimonas sp. AU4 TaxID=1638163 RepID=UPI000AFE4FDB|nr:hypothetical protein [Aureimonas sp. AU4]